MHREPTIFDLICEMESALETAYAIAVEMMYLTLDFHVSITAVSELETLDNLILIDSFHVKAWCIYLPGKRKKEIPFWKLNPSLLSHSSLTLAETLNL